jgi:hypothetical protein
MPKKKHKPEEIVAKLRQAAEFLNSIAFQTDRDAIQSFICGEDDAICYGNADSPVFSSVFSLVAIISRKSFLETLPIPVSGSESTTSRRSGSLNFAICLSCKNPVS